MKRILSIVLCFAIPAMAPLLAKKDKSNDYQLGIYVAAVTVNDGTLTSTIRGDGTTVAGDVYSNRVRVYTIKVSDGTWHVETMTQALDSMMRSGGMTPPSHKAEKANPLDFLKDGDKVLFRLEKHRKLIGGIETDMYVPFADNPDKEVEFATTFTSNVTAAPSGPTKTDNVKALCESGRLSPELHKQYCEAP